MKLIKWMFEEVDGSFSWRKGLAFTAAVAFLFAIVGFFIWDKVLPKQYWATISGVFIFYFIKNLPRKQIKDSK